jgi:hypothetical protein
VKGRVTPVALSMVTCALNHPYANLYAFVPGANPAQPVLFQRLALYQGREQPVALSTRYNRVTLAVIGIAKGSGLCCPTLRSVHRWAWNGHRFYRVTAQ